MVQGAIVRGSRSYVQSPRSEVQSLSSLDIGRWTSEVGLFSIRSLWPLLFRPGQKDDRQTDKCNDKSNDRNAPHGLFLLVVFIQPKAEVQSLDGFVWVSTLDASGV